jgi:prolyl-tRNA synthetase
MIDFVKNSGILSYKNLPMRLSQISNVYRNLKRAEGLYKSKEISCVVLTSFDKNKDSYLQTIEDFKVICDKAFADMGIQTFYVQDNESGAIEYMYNTELADRPLEKSIINNFGNANEFADKTAYGSLSMGYPFHQINKFCLFFVDNISVRQRPFMGTFGIGTQRCIHNLFEKAKNGERRAFTKSVRPFDVGVITVGIDSDNNLVKEVSDKLNSMHMTYCIDDRNLSIRDKMQFSEFFSIPVRILIGKKELAANSYSVKLLNGDNTNSLNLSETLAIITKLAMER